MMNLALIMPTAFLPVYGTLSRFHMAIASVAKHDFLYRDFFRRRALEGDYVVLDNGAFEGELVEDEDLLWIAEQMSASEVVVPDVIGDPEATLRAIDRFTTVFDKRYPRSKPFNLMMVPQGQNLDQYLANYKAIIRNFNPDVIGVAKHTAKFVGSRLEVFKALATTDAFREADNVHYHALGGTRNLATDLKGTSRLGWVRSYDTSAPFAYGLRGIVFDQISTAITEVDRPDKFFTRGYVPQELILSHNILCALRWARG